jgi:hypothetical protein
MNPSFKPMDVMDNCPGIAILSGPTRVLGCNEKNDDIWLIDFPRRLAKGEKTSARRDYVAGPYRRSLAKFQEHLQENRLHVLNTIRDPKFHLTDADRLNQCQDDAGKNAVRIDLQRRDHRFEAIHPLLCTPGTNELRIPMDVLADNALAKRLAHQAKILQHAKATLYNWIHRYWAGGCQKNALLSDFSRCGSPGQAKQQNNKLGRSSRLYKEGLTTTRGYKLTEDDKGKLKWGYRLIKHDVPMHDAYLTMCAVHWAEHQVDTTGKTQAVLFNPTERPTFSQFSRWGALMNDTCVTEMLLGPTKYRQLTDARGGSEQDLVVAVGQLAGFDGTSTDVYLTSHRSRLKKLPPMTRLILKEIRVGLIYGMHCSWEPPSPKTALLTVLHGAMPSKVAWAKRFGVQLEEGVIPGLLCRTNLADHGELKGADTTEAETQFGFGIDLPPTMSGDRKGGVESQHHADHAHLDRKLPGTTRGKRPGRGDDLPVTHALWNYYEYMRELIEHIIWHNSVQEMPDLAPDDMLLTDPPIRPTRINIYHWLTGRGMNVSLPYDYEALRAFTLPDVDAVIRKNGIYLEMKIHGRKMLLPRLRFTGSALVKTGLMSQVKRSGSPIHTRLKMDPTDLSQAWLPTKSGLIQVFSSARDTTIHSRLTLDEYVGFVAEKILEKDMRRGDVQQGQVDTILRRAAVTDAAHTELKAEEQQHGKRVSITSLKANLRQNRDQEIQYLRVQQHEQEQVVKPFGEEESQLPQGHEAADELTASDLLMEALYTQESNK